VQNIELARLRQVVWELFYNPSAVERGRLFRVGSNSRLPQRDIVGRGSPINGHEDGVTAREPHHRLAGAGGQRGQADWRLEPVRSSKRSGHLKGLGTQVAWRCWVTLRPGRSEGSDKEQIHNPRANPEKIASV
jgi:hypothetical protein